MSTHRTLIPVLETVVVTYPANTEPCSECDGTGTVTDTRFGTGTGACEQCDGTGRVGCDYFDGECQSCGALHTCGTTPLSDTGSCTVCGMLHEHTEDDAETDNGRLFCWCGAFIRNLDRDDFDTHDYWRDAL